MKIVLIGGSGFIGKYCEKYFDEKGHKVVVLDISPRNDRDLYCDIRDIESLRSGIPNDADCVINLAAEHKDDVQPVSRYYNVNVTGSQNICQVMMEKHINKAVFISSVAVYGSTLDGNENGLCLPDNDYGKSKLEGEKVFRKWASSGVRSLSIIRPTAVFGIGNRGNIYRLIRHNCGRIIVGVGIGKNVKSIAFVENVARFISTITLSDESGKVYNYVDLPNLSVRNLAEMVSTIYTGKQPVYISVPIYPALLVGYFFDFISTWTKFKFSISAERIRRVVSSSIFSVGWEKSLFPDQISIKDGLVKTISEEFLNQRKCTNQ